MNIPIRIVMRVLIPLAVIEIFHQLCRRIANMHGHGQIGMLFNIGKCAIIRGINSIALGGCGEINRRLSNGQIALGTAQKVVRLAGIERDL